MNPIPLGELAGLLTATCWSFSSILFTFASRQIGSLMVNRWRLAFAVLLLLIFHTIIYGSPLPNVADNSVWFWLGLSGLVGLVIGDTFLFRSYVIIGPRSSMVLMAIAPVFSSLLAFVFLSEKLTLQQYLGVFITISGVAWAIAHHSPFVGPSNKGKRIHGILYGLGAAFCQGVGLILARKGLETEISAFSANLIRMSLAASFIWLYAIIGGKFRESVTLIKNRNVLRYLVPAAVIGPFLGVWFSLLAVKYAPIGIASTMMSSSPVLMIPLSKIILGEKIHFQSIVGTILALAGLSILLSSVH